MEEYQEADILWPESTKEPKSIVDLQNYLRFASSKNGDGVGAMSSLSLSSASSSSIESTCTQESDFSCPDDQAEDEEEEEYNSYFFSVANLTSSSKEETIGCDDEDWQEADVLWPDKESPATKYRDWDEFVAWAPGNCSPGDHEHPLMKRDARKNVVSSPIDVPKSKMNYFAHLL